ncbi:adenylate/guanylate cyclase domain-containing protein [Variovorax sp. LjRoot290]|uniref:adenylate/guanylate cyclase domain-containing protein n=1 Tax=Variovorax sp. LjRoot290 TaxID=3342316 RepID=UPI003F50EF74
MTIFGAPLPLPDHSAAAVRAALDMVEMIELLNTERIAADKPAIRIGVGIATGEMVAGYAGTQQRATYTCIGGTVNLAARLEAHTKLAKRMILIDPATCRHSLDAFRSSPSGRRRSGARRRRSRCTPSLTAAAPCPGSASLWCSRRSARTYNLVLGCARRGPGLGLVRAVVRVRIRSPPPGLPATGTTTSRPERRRARKKPRSRACCFRAPPSVQPTAAVAAGSSSSRSAHH